MDKNFTVSLSEDIIDDRLAHMYRVSEWLFEVGSKPEPSREESIALREVPCIFPEVFDMPYMEYDILEMAQILKDYTSASQILYNL